MARVAGLLWGVCALSGVAHAEEPSRLLIIRDDDVAIYLDVELALTPEDRSRGLMWRRQLSPRTGMLFDFGRSQPISMWMKNTLIPLDMVFIDASGAIVDIARSAKPLSTESIRGALPARYVLELNGGAAKLYDIETGARSVLLKGAGPYPTGTRD